MMDKENLKQELTRHSVYFTNGGINCEGITLPLIKYIIDNFDDTPTTEQAWEKIAEIFDDDDPDMLKDVCMNVLKAFNGGYPMLVTEGHICTWNPDVGKPEKEELPDYIIEYLDNALTRGKNKNFVLENLYLELFRKDFGHFYSTSDIVLDWIGISGNATRIIDAIRNGYKPYKEPVWVVKTFAGYLTDLERSVN
ncbi:MAG: hypothetical protein L0L22_14105, partial [Staphylococcus equorum]|nr:hypothetical protein [Staphylococcus equorum]